MAPDRQATAGIAYLENAVTKEPGQSGYRKNLGFATVTLRPGRADRYRHLLDELVAALAAGAAGPGHAVARHEADASGAAGN